MSDSALHGRRARTVDDTSATDRIVTHYQPKRAVKVSPWVWAACITVWLVALLCAFVLFGAQVLPRLLA